MSTVTIINIDGSISKKSPAFIENKTTLQILEGFPQLNRKLYSLAIKTPAYITFLQPNSIPAVKYPSLIVNDLDDINKIPDFALLIIKNSEKGKTFLTFSVSSTNIPEIIFPQFSYGFIPQIYSKKHISVFLSDLSEHFGLQITDPKIFLNNEEVSNDEYVKKILKDTARFVQLHSKKQAKSDPIEFKFNIEPQGLKTIRLREKTLEEILNTERAYFLTITILYNHFGKLFHDQKIINENDYQTIFGPIPKMIQTSAYLTTELAKQKSYSSCVAQIFSKFLFDFKKTSQEYFVNYNQKTKFMTDKLDSMPQVQKICQQTPGNRDVTFQMMAIQPIQRFPRYVLLLKELTKHTPESHPDFLPLAEVNEQLSQIVYEMEKAHLFRGVKHIQERLLTTKDKENKSIVTQDRVLVEEFNVFIREKKKTRSTLYLFNDLILLTTNIENEHEKEKENEKDQIKDQEREKEIMRSEYNNFIFIPNYTDNFTVLYYYDKKYKSIVFKNWEEMKKFQDVFCELRNKTIENNSQSNIPNIKATEYSPPKDQIIPIMMNTSCSKIGNLISVVSHHVYITYDTIHKTLEIQTEVKNVHDHAKLVLIGSVPYIYGGIKKPGPFELLNNKFEESKPKSRPTTSLYLTLIQNINAVQISPPKEGRIHHTCCSYDKYIVVYGGINPRNRRRHFSDIYFYSVEAGEWFSTELPINKTPEPRYKHSASIYKNIMIIHGGISSINDRVLNDTWLFNFLDGKWTLINLKNNKIVVPRFGHSSVIVNRFMFIIGGSTVSYSFNPPPPPSTFSNAQRIDQLLLIDNFPDTDSSDQTTTTSTDDDENNSISNSSSNGTNSLFLKDCIAAVPGCFCLNIETGKLDSIEIEGNFLPGISQSSAVFDENNGKIVIFGGTDPQNCSIKGTSIVTSLDIPNHYKSAETKPPEGPVNIEKVSSLCASPLVQRKKSYAYFSVINEKEKQSEKDNENNQTQENNVKVGRSSSLIKPNDKEKQQNRKFRRIKKAPTKTNQDDQIRKQVSTPDLKHVIFQDMEICEFPKQPQHKSVSSRSREKIEPNGNIDSRKKSDKNDINNNNEEESKRKIRHVHIKSEIKNHDDIINENDHNSEQNNIKEDGQKRDEVIALDKKIQHPNASLKKRRSSHI